MLACLLSLPDVPAAPPHRSTTASASTPSGASRRRSPAARASRRTGRSSSPAPSTAPSGRSSRPGTSTTPRSRRPPSAPTGRRRVPLRPFALARERPKPAACFGVASAGARGGRLTRAFPRIAAQDPDVLSINAASAALLCSDVPWNGPVGARTRELRTLPICPIPLRLVGLSQAGLLTRLVAPPQAPCACASSTGRRE